MPDPDDRTAHLPPPGWLPPLPTVDLSGDLSARVAVLEATVDEMEATIGHLTLMLSLASEALRSTGPPAGR